MKYLSDCFKFDLSLNLLYTFAVRRRSGLEVEHLRVKKTGMKHKISRLSAGGLLTNIPLLVHFCAHVAVGSPCRLPK